MLPSRLRAGRSRSPPPPFPLLLARVGPAIYQFQQVRQGFWEPLLIAIGLAESYRVSLGWATPTGTGFNNLKDEYVPGDLGFDPLGLKPKDAEELKVLQTKELNNGRLAMIAIAGFVVQELVVNRESEPLLPDCAAAAGLNGRLPCTMPCGRWPALAASNLDSVRTPFRPRSLRAPGALCRARGDPGD